MEGEVTMKRLFKSLLSALVILVIVEIVLASVFRRGNPVTMRYIARWNRRYLNPVMLKMAGRPHWYASSVHHVGRTTGEAHETPVWAHEVSDGFVVPLPYGTDVDWLRNLQAAGSGSIVHEGGVFRLSRPTVIDRQAAFAHLGRRERIRYRTFGVKHFLHIAAFAEPAPMEETG
jgi:hypothetical protein